MSLPDIRQQIKTIISRVEGIGIVHDRARLSSDWNKFLNLFQDTDGLINGCMFSVEKRQKRQSTMGEEEIAYVFVFRRFMGMRDEDATGIVFEDHIEDMAGAFNEYEDLNGTCRTINPDWGEMSGAIGLQIDIIEPRMIGNVLCHYAESRLCVIAVREI